MTQDEILKQIESVYKRLVEIEVSAGCAGRELESLRQKIKFLPIKGELYLSREPSR